MAENLKEIVDISKKVSYYAKYIGDIDNMRKILESCPTCGGDFAVTELRCVVCETVVRSEYSPCPFCRLSAEDLAFLLVFVRNRGNVKEMERELGVSYWTIRGRLNELLSSMGLEPGAEPDDAPPAPPSGAAAKGPTPAERQAILERLRRGEITPEQAAKELRISN